MMEPCYRYRVEMPPLAKQALMDGDTWWMNIDLGLRVHVLTKIRLKDYSCPERKDPGGAEAKARALTLLYGASVVIVETHKAFAQDRAIYDRWEGTVWCDGNHLGEQLFAEGFATHTPQGVRMKVTKDLVKMFESDQKKYGTETAIRNVLWLNGSELLHDLDVKKVKTTERKKNSRKR
jgi:endonuclease YncB( thermonuclease family)